MGYNLSDSIWDRGRGYDELSERGYLSAIGLFTTYGLGLCAITAYITMGWQMSLVSVLLLGLGLPIMGILIAQSDNWLVSFIGYTMVVLGLGAITGPTVAHYKIQVVMTALFATGGVSLAATVVGIMFPRLILSWGGYLFGALVALLFVRLAQLGLTAFGVPASGGMWIWVEYFSAALFSLYIVFDWNRAAEMSHTMDNAVDCSLAIFLDIINLFMSLLRIFGESDD